jgi:MATE family, multidrug efflux pump
VYGFFGVGLALYFASQGAGRLAWPLVAGFTRLAIAAGGGALAVLALGGGLAHIFGVMALALVVFGTVNALAVKLGAWRAAGPGAAPGRAPRRAVGARVKPVAQS